MDSEEHLAKQVEEYQKIAKENPNVNVSMLMLNALSNEKQNKVSSKAKRISYFVSIGIPPFGFLIALKYFWSSEEDAPNVAWTCVILTILSVITLWITGKIMLSGSGTSINQISNIKTQDIMQLTQ